MMARWILLLMLASSMFEVKAQSWLMPDYVSPDYRHYQENRQVYQRKWIGVSAEETSVVTMNAADVGFNKTFLMDDHGSTVDQGYAPGSYFAPNNNRFILKGRHRINDSLNPYGALDLGEAIFLGAINQFITELGKSRKKHPRAFHH
jgi:hypothetical protein